MSTAEIIRRFSENESQFRIERGNYTYSQSVLVEASYTDGSQSGKYELNSDIVFTPEGKRYEKVTYRAAIHAQGDSSSRRRTRRTSKVSSPSS